MRCRFVKDFSWNDRETITPLKPLYRGNMGQRTGLSFENIKTINLAYCADKCSPSSLAQPCQHDGYQDPNNCNRCICPDGFDGQYCNAVAGPTNGKFSLRSLWCGSFTYHIIFHFIHMRKAEVIFCFQTFQVSKKSSFINTYLAHGDYEDRKTEVSWM